MSKETFYFSHDYNARSDRKMIGLLMKAGIEGIGIYWCVVEMLYEEGGYMLLSECERIAFELRTHIGTVTIVLQSSLFECDGEKFWSKSVLERIEKRKQISEGASNAAKTRWGNANAMRTHSEGNAIKVKESKLKEIKENEIKLKNRRYEDFDLLKKDAAAAFTNYFSFFDDLKGVSSRKVDELARSLAYNHLGKDIKDFDNLIKGWSKRFQEEISNGLHKEQSKTDTFSPL